MKIPDYMKDMNKESSHKTMGVNTMSLAGLSLLWGHMLSYVSWWALPLTVLLLIAGFGNEIRKRNNG